MIRPMLTAVALTWLVPPAQAVAPARGGAQPLAHTYSIVARDPRTGELGVAVQSHYFSVGPVVPWAEAGVGAVATQSLVRVDYGPLGLDLMRQGMSAREALDSLLRADPEREGRQVAMVDARGGVAAYTGPMCIADAGHVTGEQFSVQANLMADPGVWPAMKQAFESASGDLAERMMVALEAAERAGGDIRGRQSAAMLVVKPRPSGKPWNDVVVQLRVEDHEEPLAELRRLLRLRRAYRHADEGDAHTSSRRHAEAARSYAEAARLAPDVVELQFWAALAQYTHGREAEGLNAFRRVFARESRWVDLIPRLARVGLFPDDPRRIAEVQAVAPRGHRRR